MDRYKIIVNPTSAHGAAEQAIPRIEELLRGYGLAYDLVRTERPWHAAELAQQAAHDGYNVVVAAGGDGTANEVLNGLLLAQEAGASRSVAMGLLGIGRGNDFAFGMGVPQGVEEGCRILAEGRRRTVDVGRVSGGLYPNGRYFGNGVGIGFDATVGFEAAKMTRLRGFLCYIVAALKTIFLYYSAPLLRIQLDDQALELPALLVSIMNGRRMGGGFLMAPQGRPDDGLFDLCIARQVSRLGVLALMPLVMKGTQGTHPAISMPRSRRVTVTALKGSLPAHADGETLCVAGQQLEMELLPGRLQTISQG
jgi:diacylglycerol kinase (ATP)